MHIELNSGNMHLANGQTLKVRDGAGSTVCCRSGTLWVTEERRPRDVLLSPGGCHLLSQRGVALVQALGEADVAIA
ncbi:MAG TPA: DUF2917 domain-containing protein [Burkholderiales bacterium]|nr:DUF2917 domain-containing protein [Burkholderiales bacterium]